MDQNHRKSHSKLFTDEYNDDEDDDAEDYNNVTTAKKWEKYGQNQSISHFLDFFLNIKTKFGYQRLLFTATTADLPIQLIPTITLNVPLISVIGPSYSTLNGGHTF